MFLVICASTMNNCVHTVLQRNHSWIFKRSFFKKSERAMTDESKRKKGFLFQTSRDYQENMITVSFLEYGAEWVSAYTALLKKSFWEIVVHQSWSTMQGWFESHCSGEFVYMKLHWVAFTVTWLSEMLPTPGNKRRILHCYKDTLKWKDIVGVRKCGIDRISIS